MEPNLNDLEIVLKNILEGTSKVEVLKQSVFIDGSFYNFIRSYKLMLHNEQSLDKKWCLKFNQIIAENIDNYLTFNFQFLLQIQYQNYSILPITSHRLRSKIVKIKEIEEQFNFIKEFIYYNVLVIYKLNHVTSNLISELIVNKEKKRKKNTNQLKEIDFDNATLHISPEVEHKSRYLKYLEKLEENLNINTLGKNNVKNEKTPELKNRIDLVELEKIISQFYNDINLELEESKSKYKKKFCDDLNELIRFIKIEMPTLKLQFYANNRIIVSFFDIIEQIYDGRAQLYFFNNNSIINRNGKVLNTDDFTASRKTEMKQEISNILKDLKSKIDNLTK